MGVCLKAPDINTAFAVCKISSAWNNNVCSIENTIWFYLLKLRNFLDSEANVTILAGWRHIRRQSAGL
jgi:hypothetical protein